MCFYSLIFFLHSPVIPPFSLVALLSSSFSSFTPVLESLTKLYFKIWILYAVWWKSIIFCDLHWWFRCILWPLNFPFSQPFVRSFYLSCACSCFFSIKCACAHVCVSVCVFDWHWTDCFKVSGYCRAHSWRKIWLLFNHCQSLPYTGNYINVQYFEHPGEYAGIHVTLLD